MQMWADFFTTSSLQFLPSDHPLRRFIKPFTFRTVAINYAASSQLCSQYGLLHRTVALTWESLEAGFKASFDYDRNRLSAFLALHPKSAGGMWSSIFEQDPAPPKFNAPLPEELAQQGKYPFLEDAHAYIAVVSKFVSSYIDVYYKDDTSILNDPDLVQFWSGLKVVDTISQLNTHSGVPLLKTKQQLKDVLSIFIFHVTGLHLHLGTVGEYLVDPTYLAAALRPGQLMSDVQKSFQAMAIALSTGTTMPSILGDLTHMLLNDDKREITVNIYEQFNKDLRQLSKEIDEKNKKRKWPCNAFNPRLLTTSVSV